MREISYYKIKIRGYWTIGYYDAHALFPWTIFGDEEAYKEDEIQFVGDKITLPDD